MLMLYSGQNQNKHLRDFGLSLSQHYLTLYGLYINVELINSEKKKN